MRTRFAIALLALAVFGACAIALQQPGAHAAVPFSSPLAPPQPRSTPTPRQMDRIQPMLADVLRKTGQNDLVPVILWPPVCSAMPDTETDFWTEAVRIVAGEGPDAQERILEDPLLRSKTEEASRQLRTDAINACVAPIMEWLSSQGIEGLPSQDVPAVSAMMSRTQIDAAATSPLIATMSLDYSAPAVTPFNPNLVTPTIHNGPVVIPTPTPGTDMARVAIQYISERESIPLDELYVGAESPMFFQGLGRTYQYVSVVHNVLYAPLFSVLVDPDTLEI